MPSKKGSVAYEARLARRRAQRKINKLEAQKRSAGIGTRAAYDIQQEISAIERAINATYQKPNLRRGVTEKRTAQQVAKNLDILQSYTPSVKQTRKNLLAMYEISHAYDGFIGPRTKKYTEGEMHIFFSATVRAWQGLPKEQRGRAIMEAYHVGDLEAFIQEVLDKNQLAIDVYEGRVKLDELSKEQQDLYQNALDKDTSDKEKYDSLYMTFVQQIDSALSV